MPLHQRSKKHYHDDLIAGAMWNFQQNVELSATVSGMPCFASISNSGMRQTFPYPASSAQALRQSMRDNANICKTGLIAACSIC